MCVRLRVLAGRDVEGEEGELQGRGGGAFKEKGSARKGS